MTEQLSNVRPNNYSDRCRYALCGSLEKAGRLLQMMSQFLAEAVEEHDKVQ